MLFCYFCCYLQSPLLFPLSTILPVLPRSLDSHDVLGKFFGGEGHASMFISAWSAQCGTCGILEVTVDWLSPLQGSISLVKLVMSFTIIRHMGKV